MQNYRFSAQKQCIRKKNHFQYFFANTSRIENDVIRIYYADAMLEAGKVAFVVSKKIGKAVRRNKVRRWFREIYRLHQDKIDSKVDMMIVAKPKINTVTYKDVTYMIEKLLEKRNLLIQK